MDKLRRYQPLITFIAVLGYALCSFTAYSYFPGDFSPIHNWLSDLGDINQNPTGAIFYNLGIFLTGALVLTFFLSISPWQIKDRHIQNRLVKLTQICGVLGSIALIFSAVFPINYPREHQIMSVAFYILLGTAFAFSVTALRYRPGFPKWLMAIGGITAFVDILSGIYHEVTILEWITVALFLAYLVLLGHLNFKIERKPLMINIPSSIDDRSGSVF